MFLANTHSLEYFFFGHSDGYDILGWHITVLLTAIITWQIAKLFHSKNKDKR